MKDNKAGPSGGSRIPVDAKLSVQFINPKDSVSGKSFKGAICDLNERGARLTILDLSKIHFQRLIRDPELRIARLNCKFPTVEKTVRLYGRILYFDYRRQEDANLCTLVVEFMETDAESQGHLRDYLAFASAQLT